jgi:hypothetical protein
MLALKYSILKMKILIYVRMAFVVIVCISFILRVIFLSEIIPRFFTFFYKGDVLCSRCMMKLDQSTSMRETNGVNIIFIDLHVPTFRPRLHRGESAL